MPLEIHRLGRRHALPSLRGISGSPNHSSTSCVVVLHNHTTIQSWWLQKPCHHANYHIIVLTPQQKRGYIFPQIWVYIKITLNLAFLYLRKLFLCLKSWLSKMGTSTGGCFVKREHWKRWQAERNRCPSPSTGDASVEVWGYEPWKCLELYMQNPAI